MDVGPLLRLRRFTVNLITTGRVELTLQVNGSQASGEWEILAHPGQFIGEVHWPRGLATVRLLKGRARPYSSVFTRRPRLGSLGLADRDRPLQKLACQTLQAFVVRALPVDLTA